MAPEKLRFSPVSATRRDVPLSPDPDGNETTYTYDDQGRLSVVTDPNGNTTTYEYDSNGRLALSIDRDGRRRTYFYDDQGDLIEELWYDANGGVVDILRFSYDDDGRLISASNNEGTYTYTYDASGRLSYEAEPFEQWIAFAYSDDGLTITATDSSGAVTVSTYDGFGNLLSRELSAPDSPTIAVSFDYNTDGRLVGVTRTQDGTVVASTSYDYDSATGQPADIVHVDADGNVIDGFLYTYDASGRLASEGELTPGYAPTDPASDPSGTPPSYAYDATGQLTGEGTSSYAYDANGNRTGTGIVTGPDNQVLSDGTWDYTYDAEGNRTGKVGIADGTAWAYTYDNANRLTAAVERDASGAVLYELDLAYDVFGNLIQEVEPTSVPGVQFVSRYAYDGANVRSDLNADDQVTTHYLTGDAVDAVFARESASGTVGWYLTDRLGSVRDIIDGTGSVLDHRDYDPFGNIASESDPSQGDRYGFAGMTIVANVGVYYDRARDYDPFTGTFTTQDPLGFDAGDADLYRYVVNSPTNGTDPSGLWGEWLRTTDKYVGAAIASALTGSWIDPEVASAAELKAAYDRGSITGGKAAVNGLASATVDVFTLGYYESAELIAVTEEDRANGYDTAVRFSTASGEILLVQIHG